MCSRRLELATRCGSRCSPCNTEALQSERADRVAAHELVRLVLREAGLRADLRRDFLRPRERRVGVRVVGLEADLIDPDDVTVREADLVVEDAAVDPILDVA